MPYTKSRYSMQQNREIKLAVFDALNNSEHSMTADEICHSNLMLRNVTTQKISRVLTELVEMGLAKKAKSATKKKMVYSLISHVEDSDSVILDDF